MNSAISDTVWVVDDDRSICWVLQKAFKKAGYPVRLFNDGEELLSALESNIPTVIFSDVRMPVINGIDLLKQVNANYPEIPVVIMTAFGDLDSAVDAYQGGAFEYLPKPFDVNDAILLVGRAVLGKSQARVTATQSMVEDRRLLGESAPMQEIFRVIGRLAGSSLNVLIRGESGTGKELVAQALYQNSPRADKPYVAINTAAIPAELLESELFGHEKGAFTGAHSRHIGRFEQAHGGTLFLDEIGDMPAMLQTRLLRVLSEGRFYRVGGRELVSVDVRIIAATNQDLETRVDDGDFRIDLFHRLNVVTLELPVLRDHSEDIPLLVHYFLEQTAAELGVDTKLVDEEVIQRFQRHGWPGNIRELENLCRRLTIMTPGKNIHLSDLDSLPELTKHVKDVNESSWKEALTESAVELLNRGNSGLIQRMNPVFEQALIDAAMAHTGGQKRKAAELLGWGRNTLTRKMQQLKKKI